MSRELKNIARLHRAIDRALFRVDGNLSYDRIVSALSKLADMVHAYPASDDGFELWNIGEFDGASLYCLLVGAYWHFSEWHRGQWSAEYAALCAIGQVYSPNMANGPEPESSESDVYDALAEMAEKLVG